MGNLILFIGNAIILLIVCFAFLFWLSFVLQIEESKKGADDIQQSPETDTIFKNTFVWIVQNHPVNKYRQIA